MLTKTGARLGSSQLAKASTARGIGASAATTEFDGAPTRASGWFRTAKARSAAWIGAAAAHYAAAALYAQLSRLSDVELARRGLSRGRLAQDVADTRQRRRGGSP